MAPKLTAQRRLQGASTQMCSSICVSVLTRMFAVLFLLRFPARKPWESVEVQKLFSKEPLHAHSAPSLPPSPANGRLRLMRSCLGQGVGCHGLPPTANPTDEHYCLVVKHMFNVSLAVENQLSVTWLVCITRCMLEILTLHALQIYCNLFIGHLHANFPRACRFQAHLTSSYGVWSGNRGRHPCNSLPTPGSALETQLYIATGSHH